MDIWLIKQDLVHCSTFSHPNITRFNYQLTNDSALFGSHDMKTGQSSVNYANHGTRCDKFLMKKNIIVTISKYIFQIIPSDDRLTDHNKIRALSDDIE